MAQPTDILHQLAQAILDGDALQARAWAQEFYRHPELLTAATPPPSTDANILALSAGLVELFAQRLDQRSPGWTQLVGPVPNPIYLLQAAHHMKHLRVLCEQQSPEPLRRRQLFAPPNYLEMV